MIFPLLLAGAAGAAPISLRDFTSDTWRSEDDLPHNTVKTILQSRNGYLWLGTRFGLVRFDGDTFRAYTQFDTEGLTTDNCDMLAEDESGSLWIGDLDRVIRYRDRKFTTFVVGKGSDRDRLWNISGAPGNGIFLATSGGLRLFHNGVITDIPLGPANRLSEIETVQSDSTGEIWAGTSTGVFRVSPSGSPVQELIDPDGKSFRWVACLETGNGDEAWIGTKFDGLFHYKAGAWNRYFPSSPGRFEGIRFVKKDSAGNVWICSSKGRLFVLHDGRPVMFDPEQSFFQDDVACMIEDKEGSLWFGTYLNGLKRLQPRWIKPFTVRGTATDNNIWSVCGGADGRLWYGSDTGIGWVGERELHVLPHPENLVDLSEPKENKPNFRAVFEDREGTLWVGSWAAGLHTVKNGKWSPVPLSGNQDSDQISAIYQDRAGTIWVGSKGALYRRQEGRMTPYMASETDRPQKVRAIHEDRAGILWIGTYGHGLWRISPEGARRFATEDGLSNNFAWGVFEDSDGVLWVGTEYGLNRIKDGRISPITTDEGLFDNVVNAMMEDDLGHYWISCNRGIYKVPKQKLHQAADGTLKDLGYIAFGTADGMLSSETNGEHQPPAWRSSDGNLWFPSTAGLVSIDPGHIRRNTLPPPVVIEEVIVDGAPFDPARPFDLEAGRGSVVEIQYTGNSFAAPERVQFKYRLEGFEDKWQEAGNRRFAFYTNLRPGSYRFTVLAANNHGEWNKTGSSLAFSIAPHFYQTNPFYAACALGVLLVGLLIHRSRVGVLTRFQLLERQNALHHERSRIASEMHDDLGASLTQINLLNELVSRDLGDPGSARVHVGKITTTTRDLFRAMDEIVWAVNPKHDTLSSAVDYIGTQAQQFLRTAGIRCRLDIPHDIPAIQIHSDQRHNLFLAAKEALNNVVKHAKATEVWIRARVNRNSLEVVIEDNGTGFTVSEAGKTRNGLSNLRSRLAQSGGTCDIQSAPGKGARVVFVLPVQPAS